MRLQYISNIMLYVTHSYIASFFLIALIYPIKVNIFTIFSVNFITSCLNATVCTVYTHTLAFPISIGISVYCGFRWRRSPWCLHWSHPEVTDNDQNSFHEEAERERVTPASHASWGSITQDDSITMNNAVAPCLGLECDVHHYVHADMREGKGSHEWSKPSWNKNSSNAIAVKIMCETSKWTPSQNSKTSSQNVTPRDLCTLMSITFLFNSAYSRVFVRDAIASGKSNSGKDG